MYHIMFRLQTKTITLKRLVKKSENIIINDEKVLLRSSNTIKTDVFHYSLDTKRGSFQIKRVPQSRDRRPRLSAFLPLRDTLLGISPPLEGLGEAFYRSCSGGQTRASVPTMLYPLHLKKAFRDCKEGVPSCSRDALL